MVLSNPKDQIALVLGCFLLLELPLMKWITPQLQWFVSKKSNILFDLRGMLRYIVAALHILLLGKTLKHS
jgi:hypothetical protein